MGNAVWSDKRKFIWVLFILLLSAFIAISAISYKVAHDSLSEHISENTLPLTSDNIYSEIQQDLLRPIFISSLMAQDTFVREWTLNEEQNPQQLIRYLNEIQTKYNTVTSFFVSEKSRNYYHSTGVLKQIDDIDSEDAWYFRVRSLPKEELYEINIDPDTANKNRTVVYINYKVFDFDGNFIGVTGVGLAVEKVKELVEMYQARYNRHVYFVDRTGRVTLRGNEYHGSNSLQKSKELAPLATRILTSPSASISYMRDGKSVYLNSRLVPEFKWYLMVEQEEDPDEQKLLNTFWTNILLSFIVTVAILIIANMTLGRYQRKLELMATTDKLTGVTNRQVFESHFENTLKLATQESSRVSALLLDIDHFKQVNDRHGHSIGDLVIQTVCHIARAELRDSDLICRWGGEEFLLLLPNSDLAHASNLAEKIRTQIAQRMIRVNGDEFGVTVSLGVGEYKQDESLQSLINRVDVALYQAKAQGRNKVVLST